MMKRTFLAMVGITALAVAGCGGDDDKSSKAATPGDSTPLSKAAYIAMGDEICVDTKTKIKRYKDELADLGEDAGPKEFAVIFRKTIPVIQEGLDRLRALPGPTEDKATMNAYFASRDKTLDLAEKIADASADDDLPTATKLSADAKPLTAEQDRLGRQFGFKHCNGK